MALVGLAVAVAVIVNHSRPYVPPGPAFPAVESPYTSFISGAGLVEATTENIAVGTPVSGVVTGINVAVGDEVAKNQPLFTIDDRALQAELLPATAKIGEELARLDRARVNLAIAEKIENTGAISVEDMAERRADVAIARAAVETARAQVKKLQLDIDLRTVKAPVAGKILQIKTHLGEFAEAGAASVPLMLLGGNSRMNIRVDIDEYDAWRFKPDQSATAFLRGNPSIEIPLIHVRTEPYVVPKTSFTGSGTERTDTRVLQVIYSFDPSVIGLYIGQQLDVYVQARDISD